MQKTLFYVRTLFEHGFSISLDACSTKSCSIYTVAMLQKSTRMRAFFVPRRGFHRPLQAKPSPLFLISQVVLNHAAVKIPVNRTPSAPHDLPGSGARPMQSGPCPPQKFLILHRPQRTKSAKKAEPGGSAFSMDQRFRFTLTERFPFSVRPQRPRPRTPPAELRR